MLAWGLAGAYHVFFVWLVLVSTTAFVVKHPEKCDAGRSLQLQRTNSDCWEDTQLETGTGPRVLTSALLRVSYDGAHFTGWSAGNDTKEANPSLSVKDQGRSRRRRRKQKGPGFVRSVQGVLRSNLAKLYGNVNTDRVVIEGSSRTDVGVHAAGMTAQIYCLTEEAAELLARNETLTGQPSIPGKRLPHPINGTDDSYFAPLPCSLKSLAYKLNRMCSDIRIMFITPTPSVPGQIFHPSLSAHAKTYHYTVSVGPRHDPTQYRWVWHVGEQLDLDLVRSACQVLQSGSHDFAAFQGAPRGSDDKRKRENQSTVCTIDCISIEPVSVWLDTTTYTISVTGDRFLYKQIRFLVGALVAVGTDKLQVSAIEEMLLTGTREGQTPFECAPAHGLSLHEVHYDIPIRWAGATM